MELLIYGGEELPAPMNQELSWSMLEGLVEHTLKLEEAQLINSVYLKIQIILMRQQEI